MIALSVFGWTGYARLIRGDILNVKQRDYVLAARAVGIKDIQILLRHILPNAIFPTAVLASMRIGDYVLSFAGLSFLGLGAEIGYADWGADDQLCAQLDPLAGGLLAHRGLPPAG